MTRQQACRLIDTYGIRSNRISDIVGFSDRVGLYNILKFNIL